MIFSQYPLSLRERVPEGRVRVSLAPHPSP
jgi:hypothetical protein